jgi:hypothetical protein
VHGRDAELVPVQGPPRDSRRSVVAVNGQTLSAGAVTSLRVRGLMCVAQARGRASLHAAALVASHPRRRRATGRRERHGADSIVGRFMAKAAESRAATRRIAERVRFRRFACRRDVAVEQMLSRE